VEEEEREREEKEQKKCEKELMLPEETNWLKTAFRSLLSKKR